MEIETEIKVSIFKNDSRCWLLIILAVLEDVLINVWIMSYIYMKKIYEEDLWNLSS